jgi:2-oxoglutarate ferredoxin oxidoreductase subunit delta
MNNKKSVRLDTAKCKACWKCIGTCPRQVIGKVNIIIHKHAVIRDKNKDKCIGCLKCIQICPFGAISKID